METTNKWYIAKIIFRVICGDGTHTAQFDEQYRLIEASNEKEAWIKAKSTGQKEDETFMNTVMIPVRWQFIDVAELTELAELSDGIELFSSIKETKDADKYIMKVLFKSKNIESSINEKQVAC
jgi:hypothetical protein